MLKSEIINIKEAKNEDSNKKMSIIPKKTIYRYENNYHEMKKSKNIEALLRMKYLQNIGQFIGKANENLSWHYMHELNQIAEKVVIRMYYKLII